jgi:hypothetical protein
MNEELRNELLQRMEQEQQLRSEWMDKPEDSQFAEQVAEIDSQNTAWLEKVIEQVGFPGISDVDFDGTQAVFLLIQHSPSLEFQQKCLPLLEQAVKLGEATPVHLAYLTDRVLMREGKRQIYGTQGGSLEQGLIIPHPIEDEEHVDDRRKAFGLEPLEEYFKVMNEMHKTKK